MVTARMMMPQMMMTMKKTTTMIRDENFLGHDWVDRCMFVVVVAVLVVAAAAVEIPVQSLRPMTKRCRVVGYNTVVAVDDVGKDRKSTRLNSSHVD